MKDKLSIIIPCFNSEKTLREAVESCFNQNLQISFEVVIVDDGSQDGTRELMLTLAKKYPEIVLGWNETNKGGGAARNKAASISSGKIIFCLDSDDILPPNTLGKMVSFLKEKNADGIGINQSIKFKGNNINDIDIIHTFGYSGKKVPFESLIQKDDIYCPLYSTFLITKSAFEKINGYPENHGFDTQGIAWRFLSHGFTAFQCPDTTYLHRVNFHKSYYQREADMGKVNYNWQDIFIEHLYLFTEETQKFILEFNCKDFTKNIFEELKKREKIFKSNYQELIGPNPPPVKISSLKRVYIKRNSLYGIFLRLKNRLKRNEPIRLIGSYFLALFQRIKRLMSEKEDKRKYYEQIEKIKKDKKIVADLTFGGIGDCLVWSTLPRLLKEQFDIEFYLSRKSLEVIRQPDTFKLCFEMNPYFRGIIDKEEGFKSQVFESEKDWLTFLTDKGGENVIEKLERQFSLKGSGKPKLYYKPNLLEEYKKIILIDKNTISGKRFGWKYRKNAFEKEAYKYKAAEDKIEYSDPKKQDLFRYIDMIFSCKRFIGTFSGGSAIAACFSKPFSVIWPYNAKNGMNYQFRFKNSSGYYVS